MAIKQRLKNIENRIVVAPCECQADRWDGEANITTLEPGETKPPPAYCPKCGREKKVMVVKFVYEGMMAEL